MMNPFDIQEWKPTFCKTEKVRKLMERYPDYECICFSSP